MKKETGWIPDTMFSEGIRLTVKWYLDHPEWMENVTSGEYKNYYRKMYDTRKEQKNISSLMCGGTGL